MRAVKKCSSFFFLSACAALLSHTPSQAQETKKGVAGHVQDATKVGAVWAYDWGSGMPSMPAGVEYVPMAWGWWGASLTDDVNWVASLKSKGAKTLLAFNEPDHTDQSNLSVADALTGYSHMSQGCNSSGLALISPACADDNSSWMQQFMSAMTSSGYRCDGVAVHCYLRDPHSFLSYVDGIYNKFGKPLWITEFAPTDWASPTAVTETEVINYIKIVIPGLESRSSVKRFSWYCGTSPGPNCLESAALFASDNSPTEVGKYYKNPGYVPSSPIANGTYKIIGKGSGKALDVSGCSTANGANVDIWPYWGGNCQQWTATQLGNGQYKIIGVGSGKSLDISNCSTACGAQVDTWPYWGGTCQIYNIVATSGGYYKIINIGGGKAIDINGNSTANGALIDTWPYWGGDCQQWAFQAP